LTGFLIASSFRNPFYLGKKYPGLDGKRVYLGKIYPDEANSQFFYN
jgi:hypothetical protein